MTKKRRNNGFTLAEMLIVVAIIIVLLGVAFVAVQNYQRSSTRLEFDTIAKEIFVAAQNHLTEAEGQGLVTALGENGFGTPGTLNEDKIDEKQEVYFFLDTDSDSNNALEYLLPPYAVDATVLSGSYIIRYQPSTATVLDVFYSRENKSTFLTVRGKNFRANEYGTLMGTGTNYRRGGEKNREHYDGRVIGWYGGGDPIPTGERLRVPTFEVHNEEKLWVEVTDPNTNPPEGYVLKLIVIGKSSKAEEYFGLIQDNSTDADDENRVKSTSGSHKYHITLDDITEEQMHFADLKEDKSGPTDDGIDGKFIPGENLEIKVVAYSNKILANVAMSAAKTTNSLFAELTDDDPDNYQFDTAVINNIRHLENLDALVSNFEVTGNAAENGLETFSIAKAKQTSDMIWKDSDEQTNDFVSRIKTLNGTADDPSIWLWSAESAAASAATSAGKYYPVSPASAYELTYDGQGHSVMNLDIDHDGNAGMFGTLDGSNKEIKNVIVRNSLEDDSALEIKGSVSAGGLVGSMTGGKVTNCAAAVYVNGATAGGLIGSASGVTVTDSYAGGHTKHDPINHKDYSGYLTDTSGEARVNVITTGDSGIAGGLIGSMSGGSATYCYSTCSVMGATAGGFAGKTSGGTISNSYCTGLVLGTTAVTETSAVKAFVGDVSDGRPTASGNWYYSIINDNYYATLNADVQNGMKELGDSVAFPFDKDRLVKDENGNDIIITAFKAYNDFLGTGFEPDEAKPYDAFLKNHYQKTGATDKTDYPLKTVKQLDTDPDSSVPDPLDIHYGDWPAPEILVVNPAA